MNYRETTNKADQEQRSADRDQDIVVLYPFCLCSLPLAKFLAVLIFTFALSGCYQDHTLSERPPRLLSHQEMVSFLIDLHVAEAKMNYIEVKKTDSLEMIFRNYEAYLMDQHGFTDSVYLQSYEYYLDHMELMDEIYSDVVDSLSVMSSREKAKKLEEVDQE